MSQSCSLPFANHMMVVNYNVPMLLPPFKKSLQIVTNCYKFLTIFLAFSIPSLKEFHGLFYLDYISHFLDNLFCDAKSKPPHQSHTTRYFLSLIDHYNCNIQITMVGDGLVKITIIFCHLGECRFS